jgi:hypothetical protein
MHTMLEKARLTYLHSSYRSLPREAPVMVHSKHFHPHAYALVAATTALTGSKHEPSIATPRDEASTTSAP